MKRRAAAAWLALSVGLAALPPVVSAHPRWFVRDAHAPGAGFWLDTTTVLIVLGAILYVVAAILVERSRPFKRLASGLVTVAEDWAGFDWRLIAALTGVMLIANATAGVYLAPNIDISIKALATAGAWAQALVGLLLLFQVTYSISGGLVLVVAAVTLVVVPPAVMVDYAFEFVALALTLIFIGPTYCRIDRRLFERWGVRPDRVAFLAAPVVRAGVGVTLVTLALHEKLLNPGVSLAFLEQYHFNFMPALGFTHFSDLHFVFAAGTAELTLGLLIAFGIATRVAVATLTGFFVATMLNLPPAELVGHFPLFGIGMMLVLRGPGALAASPSRVSRREDARRELSGIPRPVPRPAAAAAAANGEGEERWRKAGGGLRSVSGG